MRRGTLPKSIPRVRAYFRLPELACTPQAECGVCFRQRGGAVVVYEVRAALVEFNPTAERLRELTEKMPNSQLTEFDNVVVKARVDSRSTRSTFVVDDSTNATNQTITREEYDRISAEQDALHRRRAHGRRRRLHRFRSPVPHPCQAHHGGGELQRRRHAEAAVLPGRGGLRPGDLGAGHHGHLHA